jgi:transposase
MHVADHLSLDALQALADQEPDKRRFLRLRAVILALRSHSAPEIAEALGVSRRAIQDWVARYNTKGPDGLADRPKSGRPSLLTDSQIEQLRQRIDAGPRPEDDVCTLRGPEIRAILAREFGVAYSRPAVYFLLHRLGYACLDPRSRHLKADPEAQEEFKKKSPNDSMESPTTIPASESRSGSRTKPGSVRKGR